MLWLLWMWVLIVGVGLCLFGPFVYFDVYIQVGPLSEAFVTERAL